MVPTASWRGSLSQPHTYHLIHFNISFSLFTFYVYLSSLSNGKPKKLILSCSFFYPRPTILNFSFYNLQTTALRISLSLSTSLVSIYFSLYVSLYASLSLSLNIYFSHYKSTIVNRYFFFLGFKFKDLSLEIFYKNWIQYINM